MKKILFVLIAFFYANLFYGQVNLKATVKGKVKTSSYDYTQIVSLATISSGNEETFSNKEGDYSIEVNFHMMLKNNFVKFVSDEIVCSRTPFNFDTKVLIYHFVLPNVIELDFIGEDVMNEKRKRLPYYPNFGNVPSPIINPSGWTYVLNDQFDNPTNNNWETGQTCQRRNRINKYLSSNVRFEYQTNEGEMMIDLLRREDQSPLPDWSCDQWWISEKPTCFNYSAGEVWTGQNNFEEYYTYGYFEAVMRAPVGKGFHPGFWLFGGNGNIVEIDICELNSFYTNAKILNGSCGYHFYLNENEGGGGTAHDGQPYLISSDQWHDAFSDEGENEDKWVKFGLLWTPYEITYYINNIEVKSLSADDCDFYNRSFSDFKDMRLSVGVEIDGWNRPDGGTVFPSTFKVNSVKVMQLDCNMYKKKPDILGPDIINNGSTQIYEVVPENEYDIINWEVFNGSIIYSINDKIKFIKMDDNESEMLIYVVTTDNNSNFNARKSSRQLLVRNKLNSTFYVKPTSPNDLPDIKVKADNFIEGAESRWDIFESNIYGDLLTSSLETKFGVQDYTFEGLTPETYYVVRHGTWDKYHKWGETRRIVRTQLSADYQIETKEEGQNIFIKCTKHPNGIANGWKLYKSDCYGDFLDEVTNGWLWQGNQEFIQFDNLDACEYYTVRHGYYSESAPFAWKELNKVILSAGSCSDLKMSDISFQKTNDFFKYYPNPVKDYLIVSIIKATQGSESYTISVYNLEGKLLLTESYRNELFSIDVSSLASGMYVIELKDNKFTHRDKFIKE